MRELFLRLRACLLNKYQNSPPSQFHPLALDNLTWKFLAKLTNGTPQAAMPWFRLLAVTPLSDDLGWGGFQSLYHNYLNFMVIPPLLRDEGDWPSWVHFGLGFLKDRPRALRFGVDVGKAAEDYTRACIFVLERGEGTTEYVSLFKKT